MSVISVLKRHLPNAVHTKLFYLATKLNMLFATEKILLGKPLKKKADGLSFGVHLAEHCNLNCCSCSHFSPLAEPEFLDPEEFRRDIIRLGELFNHECIEIQLMGGEPLLHPQIISIMKTARALFTKGRIVIVSNGILLPQMPDEFWQACHDNNIGISVTHYPIKLDEAKIKAIAEKFNIDFEWFVSDAVKNFFYLKPIDLAGKGNSVKNFAACVWANRCFQLRHGRLYTCMFIPYVYHFNKRFSQNIEVTDMDSVNIYEEGLSKDTILQRLSEPLPACRFCKIPEVHGSVKWHVSEKKIDEWL